MLTFQSLLLSAVCLCSRAVPLETLRHPGGDDTDAASDRVTRTHTIDSFSNLSLLTISSQTSAPHVQQGEDEEQRERFSRASDAESLPWSPAPVDLRISTLRLGASDEDRKLGESDEDRKLGASDEDRNLGPSDEDRKLGASDEDRNLGASDEDRTLGPSDEDRKLRASDEDRKLGVLDEDRKLGASDEDRKLRASDEDRKLGVLDEDRKLGASDEDRKLGASDEDRKLGASDEDRKLGASDEDRKLGASDENRKLGASDEDRKLGASDEDRKLGASDEDRKLGASDEDKKLGASDEDRSGVDTSTTTPSGDSAGPTLLDAAETWTEAVHLRTGEVSVSSQELGTEATMSSEDLPLIFEPFEDITVSMDTGHTSSDVRLSGTSGARASVTGSHPSEEQNDDITQSSVTRATPTVLHDPPSEDLESKEEPEEDEEDSDEEEEESEEDLMESTITPHTRPPYSLIPPPPIWVQRNQGLVRSWVELIREKAGYVSGMLAPVGIGIAGALLLVGALYSIRLIHRKRRDSFKHQRRKPPREVRSGPDNAMLLADSSEDEF